MNYLKQINSTKVGLKDIIFNKLQLNKLKWQKPPPG